MLTLIVFFGLIAWVFSGLKKVPIGWNAILTFLGRPWDKLFGPGWIIVPWPFDIEARDCRKKPLNLGTLEAATADGWKVKVNTTVVYRILKEKLKNYLDVDDDKGGIKMAIDHARTQIIREKIHKKTQDEALDMHGSLVGDVKSAIEHGDWGIDILEVIIPDILPDPKSADDLSLKSKEKMQRAGQEFELEFFGDAVPKLMAKIPGLSADLAVEQVRIAMNQIKPTVNTQNIRLNNTADALVAKILQQLPKEKQ